MLSRAYRVSANLRLCRSFSKDYMGDMLKNKQRGDEDIYFSRKDKENLQSLLQKVEEQEISPQEEQRIEKNRHERLLKILRTHDLRLPEVAINDLLRWKRGEI